MSISRRAGAEILAVIIMLAFRLMGLLPTSITLILTEAILLPGKLETIIPSLTKNRGSTIAELRGGGKIPLGIAAVTSALKAVGVPRFLWLIELHLKVFCPDCNRVARSANYYFLHSLIWIMIINIQCFNLAPEPRSAFHGGTTVIR